MDKNQAMVEFLLTCPDIQNSSLFFNFTDVLNKNNVSETDNPVKHFITEKDSVIKTYVDGSKLKQYTFTIASYYSVAYNPIILEGTSILSDENMESMASVQSILDWIDAQADSHNYPDFGQNCEIEDMSTLTTDPDIDGIDTSVNPPIARYSIGVKVRYLDNSKRIWN